MIIVLVVTKQCRGVKTELNDRRVTKSRFSIGGKKIGVKKRKTYMFFSSNPIWVKYEKFAQIYGPLVSVINSSANLFIYILGNDTNRREFYRLFSNNLLTNQQRLHVSPQPMRDASHQPTAVALVVTTSSNLPTTSQQGTLTNSSNINNDRKSNNSLRINLLAVDSRPNSTAETYL